MVDPLPRTLQHGGILAVAAWLVLLIYLQRIGQKEVQMAAKYPEFSAWQQRSTRLLPGLW